ncbi:hypothetical protein D1Z90_00610 [Motilimonas pumila]|uniref:Uncharacterized protein n=2 Tax=Motilimonas pumila TaxID=2303987 RepID=A0A418YJW2_9GAMM|nr:hypothetical protein D1Z90_00610 [Motilimonas pumila]
MLLMLSATAFTFYTAKNKLFEIKASANDYSHKEAYSNAELGLDYAGTWLAFGKVEIDGVSTPAAKTFLDKTDDTPLVLGVGSSNDAQTQKFIDFFGSEQVTVVVKQSSNNPKLLQVVSTGRSRDGLAKASVSREFYFAGTANGNGAVPLAPIITNTQTLLEGSVQVASNSNAYGEQDLSYWSSYDSLQLAGDWFSYGYQGDTEGFTDLSMFSNTLDAADATLENELGSFSADTINSFPEQGDETFANGDISLSDPRFPESLKEEYLGTKEADFADLRDSIQDKAANGEEGVLFVTPDSDGVCMLPDGQQGERIVWVYGDCVVTTASSTYSAGTAENPVTLIIDGSADFSGGANIQGLVYLVNSQDDPLMSAAVNASFGGSISVEGSVIVDGDENGAVMTSGSIVVNYNSDVLSNLYSFDDSNAGAVRFGWVPGTWRDFN